MRRHMSGKTRLQIFEAKGGVCHLCCQKVWPGQEWDVSHVIPLEIGGADDETNWDVAHRRCHRRHTAEVDAPRIAKAKRQRLAHIGARPKSRNPIRGWRRFDGTPVKNEDAR